MKRILPLIVLPLALLAGGCESKFEQDCKADGGTVETDREKCGTGTRTKTTGSGTSKRTTTETYSKYKTEYDCIKDGKEIAEDDGVCS